MTLFAIRDSRHSMQHRRTLAVLEANSAPRVGRFGWKNQHASLVSFAADAYLNEMGITSPLFPEENTSANLYIGFGSEYDLVSEPEDDGVDVTAFADFMRATKAPSRGPIPGDVSTGEALFAQIGCAVCHVSTVRTASPGTRINGGAMTVPAALGNKIIHPYSDFLLHDIGSGDVFRSSHDGRFAVPRPGHTAPLWALRNAPVDARWHVIDQRRCHARHGGQAPAPRARYSGLSSGERRQLLTFLDSL